MKKEVLIMTALFVAFGLTYFYLFLPAGPNVKGMFPMSPLQEISHRSYCYFIFERIRWCIVIACIWSLVKEYRFMFDVLFAMQFLYIIDFSLTYHSSFYTFSLGSLIVEVSYSHFYGAGIGIMVIIMLINEIWATRRKGY